MNSMSENTPVLGYLHPAITAYPDLRLHDINGELSLLLDTENVFWALGKKGASPDNLVDNIVSLYQQKKAELDPEISHFRQKIDLSAVYINPTDRCNGRCPYCYIPQEVREDGINMEPQHLDILLRKIKDYHNDNNTEKGKKPVIVFHGSEPFIVKDNLFAAIETHGKDMLFGIQTNATFLEKKDVDFLIKNRVSVGLSLDSVSQNGNLKTRSMQGQGQKDAYLSVMDALEWFEGYQGLNVITTVTNLNVHELPQMIEFLHAKKVSAVLLNPVRTTAPDSIKLKPDNRQFWRYFKQAVDNALDLTINTGKKIVIANFTNTILAIIAPTARRLMCDITPCGAARRFFAIMADGKSVPCGEFIGLKEFHGHNLLDESIEDALSHEKFVEVRSRVVEKIEKCSECIYRNICGVPCPAEIYAASGSLNKISTYCGFYKEMINYAFKLVAEGKTEHLLQPGFADSMSQVYNVAG